MGHRTLLNFQRSTPCPDAMGADGGKGVVIWTNRGCPACVKAKQFFERKNINYTERRIKGDRTSQLAFARATGGAKSVPQIFIGSVHVGGFDDLLNVERRGRLNALLGLKDEVPEGRRWPRFFRR